MRKLLAFVAALCVAAFLLSGQVIASNDKDVNYWQGRFPNATCWAHTAGEVSDHGTLAADGLSATLNPWNPKWPYLGYKAVILIHADGSSKLFEDPQPGTFSFGDGTKIAKWLVCKADQHSPYTTVTTLAPATTTVTTVPATSTTVTVPSATTTTSTTTPVTTTTTVPPTTSTTGVPVTSVVVTTVPVVTTASTTTLPTTSTTIAATTTVASTTSVVAQSTTTSTTAVPVSSTTVPPATTIPKSGNPLLPRTGSAIAWTLMLALIIFLVGYTLWGWHKKQTDPK